MMKVQYKGYDLEFASYPGKAAILASYEDRRRTVLEALRPPDDAIPSAPRDKDLPLSFIQESLWLQEQMHPGTAAYNLPAAVLLSGDLEIACLERSLGEVLRRHESLRTTFSQSNGRPRQVIHPWQPLRLSVEDLSGFAESDRDAIAHEKISQAASSVFDLETGPLFRASLLRLASDRHIVIFTLHHIVSDAWSAGILLSELAALYEADSNGRSSPLPEPALQYADFAWWQRQRFDAQSVAKTLDYWRRRLAGAPSLLSLPVDYPRPEWLRSEGARAGFHFPQDLTDRIKILARQQGVTTFTLLLTAFQTLLQKKTGQEDIVIGAPVAGRARVEWEGLIGCFINTLAVRTIVKNRMRFRDLLGVVQNEMRESTAFQEVPFEKVVEALAPERNPSHTPVYQVIFDFVNTPPRQAQLSKLTMSPLAADTGAVKMDLLVDMWEAGGELAGQVEYRTSLFKPETIAQFTQAFQHLLTQIVHDPDRAIGDLEIRSDEEIRRDHAAGGKREETLRRSLLAARPQAIRAQS